MIKQVTIWLRSSVVQPLLRWGKEDADVTNQIAVQRNTLAHLPYNLCNTVTELLVDGRVHKKALWPGTVLSHVLKYATARELMSARSCR